MGSGGSKLKKYRSYQSLRIKALKESRLSVEATSLKELHGKWKKSLEEDVSDIVLITQPDKDAETVDCSEIIEKDFSRGSFGSAYAPKPVLVQGQVRPKRMEAHVVGIRELLFLEHLQLLPNIVRIVNSCSINGFYFLELEKSYDLNVAKEVRPPPNFDETMLIANSVLDALRYLHNFGIFHMDVKPANIVWTLEGNVKLCDFGTAEISPFNGKVKGTTYYSAPELIRTNWSLESVSSKCDIYSFGVTILEIVENIKRGRFFLKRKFVHQVLSENYESPGFNLAGPQWHRRYFGEFLEKAMKINAADRSSAEALLQQLEHIAARKVNDGRLC